MKRIFRALLYRLVRNRGYLLLLVLLTAFFLGDSGDIFSARKLHKYLNGGDPHAWERLQNVFQMQDLTTEEEMMERFYARQFPMIFNHLSSCMVFCAILLPIPFLGGDLQKRRGQAERLRFPRWQIIVTRLLLIHLLALLIQAVLQVYSLAMFVRWRDHPLSEISKNIGITACITLAYTALSAFLYLLMPNAILGTVASTVGIVGILRLSLMQHRLTPARLTFYDEFWGSGSLSGNQIFVILTSILYLVVFTGLTIWVFQRREKQQ